MQIIYPIFYKASLDVIDTSNLAIKIAKNLLPYNVFYLTKEEIAFYTQNGNIFREILSNKTSEQIAGILRKIFNYDLSHVLQPNIDT